MHLLPFYQLDSFLQNTEIHKKLKNLYTTAAPLQTINVTEVDRACMEQEIKQEP